MSFKNKQGSLTAEEKAVVKALLAEGWRNQDIQALLNIGRIATINSARITEVKGNNKVSPASKEDVAFFIKKKNSYDPKTGLNLYDNERLIRAREAMILAVHVFNNPSIQFKTETFAVQANIAWTYLLHEYYEQKKGIAIVGKAFSYPKPLSLIESLISQVTSGDDLIVDFFAGSATTGHAVLSVNAKDEGNRRFILVSSTEATEGEPEKNVCKDVAKERLERAVNGYSYKTRTGKKDVEGLGGDFAYLRARRIPVETIFKKIQHDQVWLALQLIHSETVTPYQKNASFQMQETEKDGQDTLVIYLPKITDAALADVKKKIKKDKEAVIYAWQPGLLKERLGKTGITYEPIPQFLVDRFGAGAKK